MTDTRAYDHLTDRLAHGRRRYLTRVATAGAARFAGTALLLVFALLVLGVAFERVAEVPIVLAALAIGGLATMIGLFVVRPLLAAPPLKAYALLAEERFPESRSLFVNALELVPARACGGSHDLIAALAAEASRRVDVVNLDALAPRALPRPVAYALAAAIVLWGAGFAIWPGPLGSAFDRLLHPRAAAASLVQIQVEPGDVTIPPGATLHVRANVLGTSRRPTLVFVRGETNERAAMESVGGANGGRGVDGVRFEGAVRGVSAPGAYWVEVSGVRTRSYMVTLSGEAGIVSFDFTNRYPAYTKLSAETQSATRGDISVLRGTDVEVIVNLDRQAESVSWTLPGAAPGAATAPLEALTPRRWKGALRVTHDGTYALEVHAGKETIKESYRIQAVADQAPLLTVIEPEGDLDLPAGGRVPIWATASDDYGLGALSLVWKKGEAAAHRVPLAHWPDQPREASATTDWDATVLALLPGESATFHLELSDNDVVSGPNVTKSRDFTIRFPLLSELYDELGQQHSDTQHALEKSLKEAKELSKQVEDLAKSLQNDRNLSWEKKQAAKEALEQQQKLAQEIEKQAKSLGQQAQTAEEHQAFDEQVLAKMRELSEVVSQIKNEALKQSMDDLAKRMDQTDPRQLQEQLKDLEHAQKEMLASLERSIELMKRIRQEEQAHEAAERAKELARRQDELNRQMGEQAPKTTEQADRLAQEQKKLEDAAKALAKDLQKLAQDLQPKSDPKTPGDLQKSAEQIEKRVTPPMEDSQQNLSRSAQNQSAQQQAKQSGSKAKKELDQLAQNLEQTAQGMSQEQDGAVAEAIRRSAQDLVNLSQAGEDALNQPGQNGDRAEHQQDLKEGAQRVVEDLIETGKNTPYLGPKAVKQLGRAINSLDRSRDAYSQGNPTQGKQAGESAVDALDQAVLALREAEQACNKPGNNPKPGQQGGSAREKMQGLSQQQGELNQETRSLAERLTQQQRLAAGDQNTVERLAAQQRMIREGLAQAAQEADRAKPEQGLLGRMEKTAEEMKQVEEKIRRGDLADETLEQQNKILSRMLDAQRSLHRRDFEQQRESNTGQDLARSSPSELRADLLKREDRARYDLLRAQSEKYPSEYRALVEAYLRRLGSSE